MPLAKSLRPKLKFHHQAYVFVREALSEAQELKFGREQINESRGHISARELLEGVSSLGKRRYGMMAVSVFRHWGILSTADFGRVVFEMIELGDMKKTENDLFEDFVDIYTFEDVFGRDYAIDISKAFKS